MAPASPASDYVAGRLAALEPLAKAGSVSAVLDAFFLCARQALPLPDWLYASVGRIMVAALGGPALVSRDDRRGTPLSIELADLRDYARWDAVRDLLDRFGKKTGGPIRWSNVYRIAAYADRCIERGHLFNIETADRDSLDDPQPSGEEAYRKGYLRVVKAFRAGGMAAQRYRVPSTDTIRLFGAMNRGPAD